MRVKRIDLHNMDRAMHYQYVAYILQVAKEAEIIRKYDLSKESLEALEKAFEQEGLGMRLSRRNPLTEKIAAADAHRDQLFRTYRAMIKAMSKTPLPEMAEAGKKLWQHLKNFRISPKMQLDQQTALMGKLLNELEGDLAAEIATLNLGDVIQRMREENNTVRDFVFQRMKESGGNSTGLLRRARKAVDAALRRLFDVCEALYIVFADPEMLEFIKKANATTANTRARGGAKAWK